MRAISKDLILPLRAEERAGKILAPRIFATGNAITYPGSHGDRIAIAISDVEKAKAALDAHIAEQQPDMVKLMLEEEGWGSRPMIPLLPLELMEKIVRYYNQHGIRTTAHTLERVARRSRRSTRRGHASPIPSSRGR